MTTVAVQEIELLMIYYLCQAAEKAAMAIEADPIGAPKWLLHSAARFSDQAEHIAQHALPGGLSEASRLPHLAENYKELVGVVSLMREALPQHYVSLPTADDLHDLGVRLRAAGLSV